MALKPLDDRVAVRPNDAKEKTDGGIYLPEQAKDKPTQGKIIAAGPGKLSESGSRLPMAVQVGDEVMFPRWGGTEIEVNGEEIRIMSQDELLAVVG